MRKKGKNLICPVCRRNFYVAPWELKENRKYCSRECAHKSLEYRRNMVQSKKGKKRPPFSETWRKNISKARKGKHLTKKHIEGIRKSRVGKYLSDITKHKIASAHQGRWKGEKNPNWRGGISFELYPSAWTPELKQSIRQRDIFTCQICNKYPAFDVHHIDYDKKNCEPENLITLCHKCHSRTNFNRKYWISYFKKIENIGQQIKK